MRRLAYLMYAAQWVIWAVNFFLWGIYSALAFVSKPGSRILVPLALGGVAYLVRGWLGEWALGFGSGLDDDTGASGAVALLILAALFIGGYYLLSRFLSLVLSVFPPVRRPIRPVLPIVAAKRLDKAVPVRIVVRKPRTPS